MIPVSSRGPTVPTRRCGALVLSALLAVPAACSGGSERQGQRSSEAVPPRVVLIGLDAADWLVIEPLVRAGEVPTFARLMKVGPTGRLHATPPLISPMLWTTIATGQSPENHGVLDFMVDLPGGRQAPVGSSNRLVPARWNLFWDAGRRVAIVGWWATWPAEPVRGVVVSDALAPQLTRVRPPVEGGVVSPPAMAARVSSAVVTASMLSHEDLAAYVLVG